MSCPKKLAALWSGAVAGALLVVGCEIRDEQLTRQSSATPASEPAGGSQAARGRLPFVEGYQQGYARAAAESKPMLVFFTAEWCQFCHQMADEAFTHPQVVRLADQFVCILVDADHEPDVCRRFGVNGYPTIQFLSPRGVPLERIVGKKPGHQVMMAMQAALQNVARRDSTERW
jgi:thiol:disulfide interchange protein